MLPTINGFLGLDFGASKKAAVNLLTEKGGNYDHENSTESAIIFDGIIFAGRPTAFIILRFFNDAFFQGSVYFTVSPEVHTYQFYEQVKSEINAKYFVTTLDYVTFLNPVYKDTALFNLGIQTGSTEISCFWKFPVSDAIDNYISMKISVDLNIILSYEDGAIAEENDKHRLKANSQDF